LRRSSLGRWTSRRLPDRVKRGLRAGRRWQRRAVSLARIRWHRSLQLRVVSTTLVLSALVIAVLGFFLVQAIEEGLLSGVEQSATVQVSAGRSSALGLSSVTVQATPPAITWSACT
jgi:hypothetical protein